MSSTTTAFKRRSIRATGRSSRHHRRRWQPLATSSSLRPSLSTTSATSTSRWTRSKWSKAASLLSSPSWASSMVAPEKFGTSRQILFPFSEPLESRLVPSGRDIGNLYLCFCSKSILLTSSLLWVLVTCNLIYPLCINRGSSYKKIKRITEKAKIYGSICTVTISPYVKKKSIIWIKQFPP